MRNRIYDYILKGEFRHAISTLIRAGIERLLPNYKVIDNSLGKHLEGCF